ncbi:MAG: hypothetical protein HZA51_08220 [Planctomycetes bacterium]|nr:hypothetical protein [Planctomycetota bacterium]
MHDSAAETLDDLRNGLVGVNDLPAGTVIAAGDVPEPFARLLVHNDHMTTRLGDYHGAAVELQVLSHAMEGDVYRRLIALRPMGQNRVVEIGLVRIDLACTNPAVRTMILDEKRPLGDLLISANVMRRVEPRWFMRFDGAGLLAEHFGMDLAPFYGRIGTIYFEDQPAIRLLEVVTH